MKSNRLPACFPSLSSLRSALSAEWRGLRRMCSKDDLSDSDSDFVGTDVRLRVTSRGWAIHSGSADYDQDHRGFWGSSCLSYGRQNLSALARELLDDARESHAQAEQGERWQAEEKEERQLRAMGLHPSQTGCRQTAA